MFGNGVHIDDFLLQLHHRYISLHFSVSAKVVYNGAQKPEVVTTTWSVVIAASVIVLLKQNKKQMRNE